MPVYNSKTIKETIKDISKLHLPAIQREFVWNKSKIESLFDSILSEYPIGTFIYWEVEKKDINKYTFYDFIKDYHEKKSKNPKIATPHIQGDLIGVLDGQQRLTSMYVALQGSYTYRTYKKKSSQHDKKCELYLNLFYKKKNDDDANYEFLFLTDAEAAVSDDEHYWFKVNTVLNWNDANYNSESLNFCLNETKILDKAGCSALLNKLYQKLCKDDIINYFTVRNQPLDCVADIFQRVNANGKPLSKSDLLFSTIVANWNEARDEVDKLLNTLNGIGDGFNYDKDFVMRACLFLTDLQTRQVVANFTRTNVQTIINNWGKIATALEIATDFFASIGFNKENVISYNALMPVIYYIYKGGNCVTNKAELRKYIISSMCAEMFTGSPDTVLGQARKSMETFIAPIKDFVFDDYANIYKKESGGKSIKITQTEIENIIDNSFKGARTFMLLSLLYPNIKYKTVKFHQDHIHPATGFAEKKIKLAIPTITSAKTEEWLEKKDRLPNLQLLEGSANQHKQDTPYSIWLAEEAANGVDIPKYKSDNYIALSLSEDLSDFDTFYDTRRAKLISELLNLL